MMDFGLDLVVITYPFTNLSSLISQTLSFKFNISFI